MRDPRRPDERKSDGDRAGGRPARQSSRVRLDGAVDDLVATHRQLVGPRHAGTPITGVRAVVRATHTARQSTLLASVNGVVDPEWTVHDVSLEDIILAYLAERDTTVTRTDWEVPA